MFACKFQVQAFQIGKLEMAGKACCAIQHLILQLLKSNLSSICHCKAELQSHKESTKASSRVQSQTKAEFIIQPAPSLTQTQHAGPLHIH